MAQPKTAPAKIKKAQKLIKQAREIPVPPGAGRSDFNYVMQVKGLLKDARELVKFIPRSVTATDEDKDEAQKILAEADQTNDDLLKWKPAS